MLVVEDEPLINQAVTDRLANEGFDVRQAYDGPTAVDIAASWQPHALVLDVMLPGFDGLEVCRRVQADRPIPVLMLTARDDETDILVGLGVGADDYLTKPFSDARARGPGERAAAPGRAGRRARPARRGRADGGSPHHRPRRPPGLRRRRRRCT